VHGPIVFVISRQTRASSESLILTEKIFTLTNQLKTLNRRSLALLLSRAFVWSTVVLQQVARPPETVKPEFTK